MTGQDHDEPMPERYFLQPNTFSIDTAALDVVRSFAESARTAMGHDIVVGFEWAASREMTRPGTSGSIDLGAGFDIVAWERRFVPESRIWVVDGLALAVKAAGRTAAESITHIGLDGAGRPVTT